MITYSSFNIDVYDQIPENKIYILDVGCGTGALGKALKNQNYNRIVTGFTFSEEEAKIANLVLDTVIIGNLNHEISDFNTLFDCIIFSHVLEHTYNPLEVLNNFKRYLAPDGLIIVALPNILFYKQRLQFMIGNFKYSYHGGLMDITHFRFFDYDTSFDLILEAGLIPITRKVSGNFPLGAFRNILKSFSKKIDNTALKYFPGLFGHQFIMVCKLN